MVKDGYKETEIGVIPEDWETVSFDDCFKILSNNTFARNDLNEGFGTIKNIHYGDVLIKFSNVIDNGKSNLPYIHENYVSKINNSFLQDGDLIIADTAEDETVGKACELIEVKQDKIVSGLHTIPCRPKVNQMFVSKWLGYYINSTIYHSQLLPYITGTKVSAISKEAIKKTVVLVPPKIEQQKIAEALSDMDNLISSLEKLIEKKKAIKQACLQKMFPRDGETVPEMRLPGFNEPWEQRKLGTLCSLITKGTTPKDKSGNGDVNFVKVENINSDNGEITSMSKISEEEHEGYLKRSRLEENDILFSIAGTLGRVSVVKSSILPANTNQAIAIVRTKEGYIPYLTTILKGRAVENFIKKNPTVGAQPNLSLEQVNNLEIPLPKKEEQIKIGDYFSNLDNLITFHQRKLEKCRKIKEGMMQQLLTGKIRLALNGNTVADKNEVDTVKVSSRGHNHQFDDAVVIAGIVDEFYSDKYPLGRKKVQKLLYLFRRHQEADISAFKKKAAGPYADEVRYKGGEPIAISNKYICVKKSSKGSSFSKGEKIGDALTYLGNWNLNDDLKWLCERFKYTKTDRLELLATIDMAMCDLTDAGIDVTVENIKNLIKSHSEWKAKLSKDYFKNKDIAWAIGECERLFS